MDDRIKAEFDLLRGAYPDAVYQARWILLPSYTFTTGWLPQRLDVAIFLREPYSGTSPCGIYVGVPATYEGRAPTNYTQANPAPPFPGDWFIVSWEADAWQPVSVPANGHKLLTWANGIWKRFFGGRLIPTAELVVDGKTFAALQRHLAGDKSGAEQAAFLFCDIDEQGFVTRFIPREVKLLQPEAFASRSKFYLQPRDDTRAALIKRAHDLGYSLVEMHSHPG